LTNPIAAYSGLFDAILTGDTRKAKELTRTAIEAGVDPEELIWRYMVPAMDETGSRFEHNVYFVPELLIAARAMKASMDLLTPLLADKCTRRYVGRVVIGTVKGDLHDIGKNLVGSMLEGNGFEVTDLGVDVSAERFVEAVATTDNAVLAMSALLTTTMPRMREVIVALKKAGVRDRLKIIVGGAPIMQDYADEIGADGYAEGPSEAVALVKSLIGYWASEK
jgi:corrinoid protein of di/trimethylamine methyltransferase